MMNKHNGTGFMRIFNAAKCSLMGLGYAFRHEESFRVEFYISLVLIPCAFWLAKTPVELILLVGSVAMVFVIECINSAIEAAIDRISLDRHPLSKQAKDLGSAAVFLTQALVLLTWSLIAWQNLGLTG